MCYYIKDCFVAFTRNFARLVHAMPSQRHASSEPLLHSSKNAFVIILGRGNGRALRGLSALLLCSLLLLLAGCAQFTATKTGQANGSTSANGSTGITYVAIGASDTFGIGTSDPYHDNWPTDLMDMLGASHVHLIDVGIPGILTRDALSLELPIALDAHPDLVTIWLGVNDIVANVPVSSYAPDLTTLLSRLRAAAPNARIAIANIPDLTLLSYFSAYNPQDLRQTIHDYNAAIASAAQRYRAILVDLTQQNYNLKVHPEYISNDGLHPNDIGYLQLAKLFYAAIRAAQKQATQS
jgi:acyl-CoA thioesterase I